MDQSTMLSDEQILPIAEEVLRVELGSLGFDHAEARSGTDHEDEPAIYVKAVLKPGTPILGGKVSSRAHGALHDALIARGERRFPYFSLHHPDGETAAPEPGGPSSDDDR